MRFIATLLLPLFLIAGCSSLPSKTSSPDSMNTLAAEHSQRLAALKQWQASGKIKITVNGEPQSAAFTWQQFGSNYAINFFGPFGYGSSWLRRTSKGITLESPEHPTQKAATPEQLLLDTVGWQAPISELQFWLKGQAAPKAPVDQVLANTDGAIIQLAQSGWTIELSRQQKVASLWLPGKIIANRDNLSVLIVIKEWELK